MVNFQEFSDDKLVVMLENPMTVKRAKAEIERRKGLKGSPDSASKDVAEAAAKKPVKRTRKTTTAKKED